MVHVNGDRIADDFSIVTQWALAGQGIADRSQLDVARGLASGALVLVLSHAAGELTPLSLVAASKHRINAGVRALAQALTMICAELQQQHTPRTAPDQPA